MKYDKLYLYTDGGCNNQNSKAIGAWAFIVAKNNDDPEKDQIKLESDSNFEIGTSNNKMELEAVIRGFKTLEEKKYEATELFVRSDSMYVIKGAIYWLESWKRNEWKTKVGAPVKNQDLWLKLDYYKNKFHPIFEWVKGHETTKYNIECDAICSKIIKEQVDKLQKI